MRYFISVIGVVVCVVLLCFVTEENGIRQMAHMVDFFTLAVMLLVVITIMIAAGLHKDFVQAFRLALSKKGESSLSQLKRAKEAVGLALRAIVGSGVLTFAIGAVESLMVEKQSIIPPNLAVSVLAMVYSACLCLLLLPIHAKLKVKIMEYMEE